MTTKTDEYRIVLFVVELVEIVALSPIASTKLQ